MKILRELRLTVFHSQHIKNVASLHALMNGLALSGDLLSVALLSKNVVPVNQTIRSVHSIKYTESNYRLLGEASTMKRKCSDEEERVLEKLRIFLKISVSIFEFI